MKNEVGILKGLTGLAGITAMFLLPVSGIAYIWTGSEYALKFVLSDLVVLASTLVAASMLKD